MTITRTQTKDGSWTCFNADVGEHYHNISGALTETLNLYIEPLKLSERLAQRDHLVIYDPFLGMGYNSLTCIEAFMGLQESQFPEARLTLFSVEKDPEILAQIPTILDNKDPKVQKIFLDALEHKIYYQTQGGLNHDVGRIVERPKNPVSITIVVGDCRQVTRALPEGCFDAIFHDAFSPRKQPELWSKTLFEAYYRILNPQTGAVFTYSAAAAIRNGLVQAGFHVYRNPFICHTQKPGTSGFTAPQENAVSLSEKEWALIHSKSGLPYVDNPEMDLTPEVILQNRELEMLQSSLITSSAVHRQFHS